MRKIIFSIILFAVPLMGHPAIATDGLSPKEQAVADTLTAMWGAIEAGDIEAYAAFIHPEHTTFGESDVYLQEGKDKEVRSIADWMTRARGVQTEMHQPAVTIVGDIAWLTYYWSDSGTTDNGRYTSRGKSTRIFQRVDGRWLSRHGHFTEVP